MSARELAESVDLSAGTQGYAAVLRLIQSLIKSAPSPDDADGIHYAAYSPESNEVDSYSTFRVS